MQLKICGCGGIGRRAGLRIRFFGVHGSAGEFAAGKTPQSTGLGAEHRRCDAISVRKSVKNHKIFNMRMWRNWQTRRT